MTTVRFRKPAVLGALPRAGAVVVEASAGTGKTYTLEHLVVDLLLRDERTTIDQILVVTFTERATSEVRQRVRETMARLLAAGPADDDPAAPAEDVWRLDEAARARLRRALEGFDAATIATIHGFCQRVLTEHAFANRRLLRQELADGRDLYGRAFRLELRQRFAARPAEQGYLRAGLAACGGVEGLCEHLYACAREPGALRPEYDPARLERALAGFPLADATMPGLEATLKAAAGARTAKAAAGRLVDLASLVAAWHEHRDLVRFLAAEAAQAASYGKEPPLDYVADRLGAGTFPPGPVQRLRDACVELAAARVPLLAAVTGRLLEPVRARVARLKREQGLFDFDDMLTGVAESLAGPAGDELAGALRARYRHALIDEFQDTDEVQWQIFRRLFLGRDDGGQLVLIGDPKQAIYGFRGADVATYVRARADLGAGGATVPLRESFRATAPLVAAQNLILDQAGAAPLFGGDAVHYDHPVSCGDPTLVAVDAAGAPVAPVVLLEIAGGAVKAAARTRALGELIAAEIRRLTGPDAPLWFGRRRAGAAPRRLQPSDVFVLTRTGAEGRAIGAHLRAHGVPHAYYKEDGLFQRPEARDVLDLLFAVADPRDRARRLRAWLTPFFGLDVAALRQCRDVPDAHPLMGRLLDWHDLAARGDFARLFGRVLEESGLVRREVFGHDDERALTNYLHLFELMLEEARRTAAPPLELARALQGYVDGTRRPVGDEGDVQRLESDAAAVQIMTMHKAKGLEAPVVFVAGGFTAPRRGRLRTYHEDGRRQAWLGAGDAPAAVEALIAAEARAENERLIYVALTRAQARVYLPYFPPAEKPYGYAGSAVQPLNERLRALVPALAGDDAGRFERRPLTGGDAGADAAAAPGPAPAPVEPPAALLAPGPEPLPFAALRRARRGFLVTSYTAMTAAERPAARGGRRLRPDDAGDPSRAEDAGPATAAPADDLPGGATTGVFLHELLEAVDLREVVAAGTLAAWRGRPAVTELFRARARQHGLPERVVPRAQELVFAALTAKVVLAAPPATGPVLAGLGAAAASARELEFLYPLPEAGHPPLGLPPAAPGAGSPGADPAGADPPALTVARGFVQGFVDYLFVHEGRAYVVDWKSDCLDDYAPAALRAHVVEAYARQEQLYVLALCKLLGVRAAAEYDARVGGVLYCFLRGMARPPLGSAGVCFLRPTWADVLAWEDELRTLPVERLLPRAAEVA